MNTAPRASLAARGRAPAPAAEPQQRCENCGNEVSQRYCGACGQRLDAPVHSLWHFSQIATEDLTHADSRVWRTLWALLAKPGHLTREFLAGRRARYLPPVRLYLVLSVVFFLVASAVSKPFTVLALDDGHPTKVLPADNTVKEGGPLPRRCPVKPRSSALTACARRGCTRSLCQRAEALPVGLPQDGPGTMAASCRRSSCTTSRARCSSSCRCSPAS